MLVEQVTSSNPDDWATTLYVTFSPPDCETDCGSQRTSFVPSTGAVILVKPSSAGAAGFAVSVLAITADAEPTLVLPPFLVIALTRK